MRDDALKNWNGFTNTIENRPWGLFRLWCDNIKCTVKELLIRKDQMLSLQFHEKRDQVYILKESNNALDGDFKNYAFRVWYSDIKFPMDLLVDDVQIGLWLTDHLKMEYIDFSGVIFAFECGIVHRVQYMGRNQFGSILDFAFGENDETDIVRLQDEYGREYSNDI